MSFTWLTIACIASPRDNVVTRYSIADFCSLATPCLQVPRGVALKELMWRR